MMSYLIYFLAIMLIPLYAQMKVRSTYNKFSKVHSTAGYTGAQTARAILDANGLYNVRVEETHGFLSDHYDPRGKVVRLSSANYHGTSVAGVAVAAHEVGHAIQDAQGYSFLRLRSSLVPVASFSSNAAWIFVMIGFFAASSNMLLLGIALLSAGVLFQLVTLPVEFNASSRAMNQIASLGIVNSSEERQSRKVLNAAALTYVAAAAVAIAEIIRLLLIYTGMQGDD